ncbi:hypothetical protein HPB47_025030 [Ixodes persulcatus]|uniref:Uncharacterized protein n=1 Tax=Ixodes persulcatus TaxID=34615 RepID=A0AC60Q4M9_IXOPE|nr:hypothetical protein HPB47_025030 [Ixodes persulcatus]
MDADHATLTLIGWKFPTHPTTTVIIRDSEVKYLHHHIEPCNEESPPFLSQQGASIMDTKHLFNFVPRGVNRLILHPGTNDIASSTVSRVLTMNRNLLRLVLEQRP